MPRHAFAKIAILFSAIILASTIQKSISADSNNNDGDETEFLMRSKPTTKITAPIDLILVLGTGIDADRNDRMVFPTAYRKLLSNFDSSTVRVSVAHNLDTLVIDRPNDDANRVVDDTNSTEMILINLTESRDEIEEIFRKWEHDQDQNRGDSSSISGLGTWAVLNAVDRLVFPSRLDEMDEGRTRMMVMAVGRPITQSANIDKVDFISRNLRMKKLVKIYVCVLDPDQQQFGGAHVQNSNISSESYREAFRLAETIAAVQIERLFPIQKQFRDGLTEAMDRVVAEMRKDLRYLPRPPTKKPPPYEPSTSPRPISDHWPITTPIKPSGGEQEKSVDTESKALADRLWGAVITLIVLVVLLSIAVIVLVVILVFRKMSEKTKEPPPRVAGNVVEKKKSITDQKIDHGSKRATDRSSVQVVGQNVKKAESASAASISLGEK